MNGEIRYLVTDLDLVSSEELGALATAFERKGVRALHVVRGGDGLWYATFETVEPHAEPEQDIAAMLTAIESLRADLREAWDGCRTKEFNLGYDCGQEPWAFQQGLSAPLLVRMAAAGVSLAVTLYPDREEEA